MHVVFEMPTFTLCPSRLCWQKSFAPGITTECLQQFLGLGEARNGSAWTYGNFPILAASFPMDLQQATPSTGYLLTMAM